MNAKKKRARPALPVPAPVRPRAPGFLRRHTTTIALAAAALGVAGYLAVDARSRATTAETEARKTSLLDVFRPDDVARITLRDGTRAFEITAGAPVTTPTGGSKRSWLVRDLARDGARAEPADARAVEGVISSLEFARYERALGASLSADERARFGLDGSARVITVEMGAVHAALKLGAPVPAPARGLYAEVEGRGVFVVSPELAAALDVTLDGLRDKATFPLHEGLVQSLSLEGDGGARRFVRAAWSGAGAERGQGFRWDGSTPEKQVRASAAALAPVLVALEKLGAQSFLAEATARAALADAGDSRVRVRAKAIARAGVPDVEVDLEVGGACPDGPGRVVVRTLPSPLFACVPDDAAKALATPAADFVDTGLGGATLDEIHEVRIAAGVTSVEIARAGAKWRVRSGASGSTREVPGPVGDALAASVRDLDGKLVATTLADAGPDALERLGLREPRARVRLVSTAPDPTADGGIRERIEELDVGAPVDGLVHVLRREDGALLALAEDAAAPLVSPDAALRGPDVFDVSPKRVRALVVRKGALVQRLERKGESFELVEPRDVGAPADVALAIDLAQIVSGLRTTRWLAGPRAPSQGLERPRLVIEAELDGGDPHDDGDAPDAGSGAPMAPDDAAPKTLRIALGARADDGESSFAEDGEGHRFLAPRALEQAADTLFVDRAALAIDTKRLARVRLEPAGSGKRALVVTRVQGAWALEGAGDASGDGAAKAAAVIEALGDLYAEAAVSYDAAKAFEPVLVVRTEFEGGAPGPVITFGGGDVLRGTRVRLATKRGVKATFAVAQSRVEPLLRAVGPSDR